MKMDSSPVIVIFGISGDLSKRKLLPALLDLFDEGILDSNTKIYGTSRRQLSQDEILEPIDLSLFDQATIDNFKISLQIVQLDPENGEDYDKLKASLDNDDGDKKRLRLFYMSLPFSAYEPIVKHLGDHGFNDDRSRLLVEKPFGHDLASAKQSIESAHQVFPEDQIYRIDHYLAKQMSQNIIKFRKLNPQFDELWDAQSIDSVSVTQHEIIGIEGRVESYEQTGALRDVIQNHLMQILAIILMDSPDNESSEALHQAKLNFLKTVIPVKTEESMRAQYEGYKDEVSNSSSGTETFARVTLHSSLDKWQDVNLVLEHGKCMPSAYAEVKVNFKNEDNQASKLVFSIQPDESITKTTTFKQPGSEDKVEKTEYDLEFKDDGNKAKSYGGYEKVILDAISGDQTLFASDDEVITSWEILEPVIKAWQGNSEGLKFYKQKTYDFYSA
jgi:glucose-6-phosphate 1-dehydrogenase